MDLSIIIVNWNSLEFLRACIRSLREKVKKLEYEIVIVDNVSEKDDSRQALRSGEFGEGVRVLLPTANLGFVRANNLGARHAKGRLLFFLNPDTEVRGGAVERLAAELEARPEAGIAGARLLNSDGSLQTSCVQPFPRIRTHVLGWESLQKRWPAWWGIDAMYKPEGVYECEVVSGACLLIKREAFDASGGFSLDYFMYAEEVDLCWAAKQRGWKTLHVSTAEVVHHGGQSTNQGGGSAFSDVLNQDSVHIFLRKSRGAAYAWTHRLGMLLNATMRMVILGLTGSRRVAKWKRIVTWALGMEGWTKKLAREADEAVLRSAVVKEV